MTRWAAAAWWAALLEARRWVREPIGAAAGLIVPVAVACLVSLALGGGGADYRTTWAVADLDDGPVGSAFVTQVPADPALRGVVRLRETSVAEGRSLLDRYAVSALVVVPPGASERVAAGDAPEIRVEQPVEPGLGTDLADIAVDAFVVRAWGLASVGGGTELGTFRVELQDAGGRSIDVPTHFGPSIALFFLFLSLGFGGQRAVEDRTQGIEDRLRVAKAPRGAVVVGRSVFGAAVGAGSMAAMAATMALAFDRGWGPAHLVVPVVLVVVACFGGIASLIAQVVRSPAAVSLVTGGLALASTVASGGFAPPEAGSRSSIAGALPTSRALEALTTVATGGGWPAVQSDLAVLAASALASVLLVSVLERRRTAR